MKNILAAFFIFLLMTGCRTKAPTTPENEETLVVLGFPATEDGQPSPLMKERLDKALKLYDSKNTKAIIVTGGAVQNQYPEGEVMKKYLIAHHIPAGKIFAETKAKNTFGNAKYSAKIIKKNKLPNPIIVTSEEHRERAEGTFSLYLSNFRMAK